MNNSVPEKNFSIGVSLGCIVVLIAALVGIRFLRANPQYLPEKPVSFLLKERGQGAEEVAPIADLYVGQSEAEVRELLGTPTGVVTVTNRLTLMYYGSNLNFDGGRLVTAEAGILAKIKNDRKLSEAKAAEKIAGANGEKKVKR